MSKNFRSMFCVGAFLALLLGGCVTGAESKPQPAAGTPSEAASLQAAPLTFATALPETDGQLQLIEFFASV